MNKAIQFFDDQSGAMAIQYSLIAALIAIAIMTALSGLGDKMKDKFSNLATSLR